MLCKHSSGHLARHDASSLPLLLLLQLFLLEVHTTTAEELVFFSDAALAVGVGPLVELRVEGALHTHQRAVARREQDGRRARLKRILGAVVHEL